jgi:hypothetical protein
MDIHGEKGGKSANPLRTAFIAVISTRRIRSRPAPINNFTPTGSRFHLAPVFGDGSPLVPIMSRGTATIVWEIGSLFACCGRKSHLSSHDEQASFSQSACHIAMREIAYIKPKNSYQLDSITGLNSDGSHIHALVG